MAEIIDNSKKYQEAVATAEKAGKHQKRCVLVQSETVISGGLDLFGNPIKTRVVFREINQDFFDSIEKPS